MWNKIQKSSGQNWDKVSEPTQTYKQFSILQEDGFKLLQEDGSQLSTQDTEILIKLWNEITKSIGQVWDKFSRPTYTPQYQTFNLLQEDGSKLLQENGNKFLTSQLQEFFKKITKSTGIVWDKIK